MTRSRKKNLLALAVAGVLLGASTTLVVFSPTLYRLYCALTGYGGTVNRAVAKELKPVAGDRRTVTVYFDANVGPGLPWDFQPMQRKVEVRLGEPTKIYYYAKNNSDKTVVARAIFNITPYSVAPYFFKIECFCFTNEKLAPGESARMPVELFIDEQMVTDPNSSDVDELTLSYTFYRQDAKAVDVVAKARALKAGSKALESTLQQAKAARFENDAPRR